MRQDRRRRASQQQLHGGPVVERPPLARNHREADLLAEAEQYEARAESAMLAASSLDGGSLQDSVVAAELRAMAELSYRPIAAHRRQQAEELRDRWHRHQQALRPPRLDAPQSCTPSQARRQQRKRAQRRLADSLAKLEPGDAVPLGLRLTAFQQMTERNKRRSRKAQSTNARRQQHQPRSPGQRLGRATNTAAKAESILRTWQRLRADTRTCTRGVMALEGHLTPGAHCRAPTHAALVPRVPPNMTHHVSQAASNALCRSRFTCYRTNTALLIINREAGRACGASAHG